MSLKSSPHGTLCMMLKFAECDSLDCIVAVGELKEKEREEIGVNRVQ